MSSIERALPLLLLLLLPLLGGCRTLSQDPASTPYIVGGHELEPDNPGRTSAVVITYEDEFRCSGVLVAPDLVLTASHCLKNQPAAGFQVHFTDSLESDNDVKVDVAAVRQFRRWSPRSSSHYDIGWLHLAEVAPASYRPVPVLLDPRRLKQGTKLTQVGYGRTSSFSNDYGSRLSVDTVFNRHVNNRMWRHVFVTGPTPGYGSCDGDSGGPSYAQIDGVWHLVGILFGAPPDLFEDASCEAGQDVQNFAGQFHDWVQRTAGARLATTGDAPALPSLDAPEGGKLGFLAWCSNATKLAPEPWYTLAQLLNLYRDTDCRRVAKKLAAATKLDLSGRALQDLRPLADLAELGSLWLAHNDIADVRPLAGMLRLRGLDLRHNRVSDLAPLRQMSGMRALLLHDNKITDLTPLGGMSHLGKLQFSCNLVEDLAPLAGLNGLTVLRASLNRIQKVSPLVGLGQLEVAELLGNPIDDADGVRSLGDGRVLFVQGSPPTDDCGDSSWTTPDLAF